MTLPRFDGRYQKVRQIFQPLSRTHSATILALIADRSALLDKLGKTRSNGEFLGSMSG
jgi:hypothetical protein